MLAQQAVNEESFAQCWLCYLYHSGTNWGHTSGSSVISSVTANKRGGLKVELADRRKEQLFGCNSREKLTLGEFEEVRHGLSVRKSCVLVS